jgi:negative regulator of genetic competence, sporulation and motility
MTTDEYNRLFPGAPIMALSDKKNTTKNSGKHMKEEKYRKMFSEKIKGEKNPNHKSNTTELEKKSRSPFSKDFANYKDIDNVEEHISKFIKEVIKDRIHPTTKEYYLSKGYSDEESQELLSERLTIVL